MSNASDLAERLRDMSYEVGVAQRAVLINAADALDNQVLSEHRCRKIASMKMGPDRDWWLGELLEPIRGFPTETHCLHITTPLKDVVLGVNRADMEQLAVLCQIVCGPINPHWLETMAEALKVKT